MSRFTIEVASLLGFVKVDREYIQQNVAGDKDIYMFDDMTSEKEFFLVVFQSDFDKTFVVAPDELKEFLEHFEVKNIDTVLENLRSLPRYRGEKELEDSLYIVWYPAEITIETDVTEELRENGRLLYEANTDEKDYCCAVIFRQKSSGKEQYELVPRSKEDLFIRDITELILQRASLDQSYQYYGMTREEIYDDLREKLNS